MHIDITNFSAYGGCSAKIDNEKLEHIKSAVINKNNKNLLIGLENNEDAAIYKINDDFAIITTVDVNTPLINDPYLFGQISACNALSDIYAKGGTPLTCLNICGCPETVGNDIIKEIFFGAQNKIDEAEALIVGGHSIKDPQLWYGLSITGSIHPEQIWKNNTVDIGDVIILTKPIGAGIIFSVYKAGLLSLEEIKSCIKEANTLNKYTAQILKKYNISAVTDVTGFGLGGHLIEMIAPKKYGIDLDINSIPVFDNAIQWYDKGFSTSITQKNITFIDKYIDYNQFSRDRITQHANILADPQTNGGFLVSANNKIAHQVVSELKNAGIENSAIIGCITNTGKIKI
jgi:selenide,water dikinase